MTIRQRYYGIFRARGWGVFLLVVCLTLVGVAQENHPSMVARTPTKDKSKLREGSRVVDRVGAFSERGGRFYFTPDGEAEQFTLLENQSLERVTSATSNQDDDAKWTVTGVITEFNGARFLLLERAVLKARKVGAGRNG